MRLGADVSTADSGEAALAVLNRADNMDLVLLDVSMPAVDGVETSRRIRAKAASLPIVFMSGHTRRAVPLELSTDDNSTFLSKPFSISALHKACANVFKSKGQDG
jgi:CheY-like chemotaxis protein